MLPSGKNLAGFFVLCALTLGVVHAHPEEFEERVSGAELVRRQHLATKRHLAARNCASSINTFHQTRRAKRSLEQIPLGEGLISSSEDGLKNSTCVTAPEIEEGPYYVNNELVRQNLVEDQEGVLLTLDIGVVDTATCEPVPDAFVEIWSANATGFYGAFESTTLGPPPGEGPPSDRDGPRNRRPGGPPRPPPPPPAPPHRRPDGPGGPGRPGPPGGGRGGGPSVTSNHTWLRGGFPTSSTGTIELTTLYPGFYPGRTIHVHLMVHMGWTQSANGTLVSHAGSIKHVGQMFFEEMWNDRVLGREPYTRNVRRRTLNEQDHDFRRASVDGSSAVVELEMVGDTIEEGLVGFITIGIDTTADYSIHSGNYYNSSAEADSSSYVEDVTV